MTVFIPVVMLVITLGMTTVIRRWQWRWFWRVIHVTLLGLLFYGSLAPKPKRVTVIRNAGGEVVR